MSEQRTVKIIDRTQGLRYYGSACLPRIVTVTVDWVCPVCGGPRGEIQGKNFCEDDEWYFCHVWRNPCGHIDKYPDVIAEARKAKETKP